MKYLLILMLIFRAAHATDQVIYYTVKGSNVTTQEALLASLRGQTVFKCQNVEAKPNKKGTSISMRNVKKVKAVE